jgi:hypothetical protein
VLPFEFSHERLFFIATSLTAILDRLKCQNIHSMYPLHLLAPRIQLLYPSVVFPFLPKARSQPTSCPFHSFLPPISPHSPSSAIAPMDIPSTGSITCSAPAAPAAVPGRPIKYESPNTIGRQPPSQTNFSMKEYDDQGNLNFDHTLTATIFEYKYNTTIPLLVSLARQRGTTD